MRKGILRRATLKDATKWINALKKKYAIQHRPPPNIPPDLDNAYVVLKKFTYPAGLYGGHSATFYIPEGVPLPTGNYGHSKIYDLNSISLECTAGSACGQAMMGGAIGAGSTQQTTTYNIQGGGAVIFEELSAEENERSSYPPSISPAHFGMQPKATAAAPPAILAGTDAHGSASRFGGPFAENSSAAPSQSSELHAVGVYEGPRHFGGMPVDDPSSSTINVHVHATKKPIILALYNYESVLWNIIADDGAVIKEIILSSYNASKVSGIDDKVVKVTRQNMGLAYDNSTAKSVAPKLMADTDLDVESFQTSYKGTEFSVGP
jgi:hypothetical protein